MGMSIGTPQHLASDQSVAFRLAREAWEFEAIHRLNYETFVEEIPQHQPNAERRLVDRFHHENTYVIAVRGERVVGMIALRSMRPFSLDGKLPDLDRHLPEGCRACEIRLLATTADSRQGFVFRGLVRTLARHARSLGHDIAVISGTTRQLRLYAHVGFDFRSRPSGSAVARSSPNQSPNRSPNRSQSRWRIPRRCPRRFAFFPGRSHSVLPCATRSPASRSRIGRPRSPKRSRASARGCGR
jgi:predicted N-acetyltransferase YhbS